MASRRLRDDLPPHVHLWGNAAEGHPHDDVEAGDWTALAPLFPYSRHSHRSAGLSCRTDESVISVDGAGTVRRCHFVRDEPGNLYDGSYRAALRPRACPTAVCDYHIGYVHLESLPLYDVFAGGVLERVPSVLPRQGTACPAHHGAGDVRRRRRRGIGPLSGRVRGRRGCVGRGPGGCRRGSKVARKVKELESGPRSAPSTGSSP